jgi:hypothetical protein
LSPEAARHIASGLLLGVLTVADFVSGEATPVAERYQYLATIQLLLNAYSTLAPTA